MDAGTRPELAAELLVAAGAVLAQRGVTGFSVAEVARRAGVSSGAPYRHFASKEALLSAVALVAARELQSELQQVVAEAGADPLGRWVAVAQRYVEFVVTRGTGFDLIFARGELAEDPQLSLARAELLGLLLGLAADAGACPGETAAELLSAQIAMAHGYATLYRDRCAPDGGHSLAEVCRRAGWASRALALSQRTPGGLS